MKREAKFSECGKYRYYLLREWDNKLPKIIVYRFDGCKAFITKSDDDNCPKGGLHDFSGALLTYLKEV